MKKFFAVLFALVLCLGLFAGCAETPKENDDSGTTNTDPSGDVNDNNDDSKDDGNGDNNDDTDDDTDDEKGDGYADPSHDVETPWEEDGILKVLMIGNSYSDDSMEYVYEIANSLDVKDVKLGILYIGSCTISMHWKNAQYNSASYDYRIKEAETGGKWVTVSRYRMKDALQSEDWDFISIQHGSGDNDKNLPESYKDLHSLVDYVKKLVPHATIGWNATWSDASYSVRDLFVNGFGNDQMTMYNMELDLLRQCVLPIERIKFVYPTGTAIQNARSSYLGDSFNRDGTHLDFGIGRYVAGLTVFLKLTGIALTENVYAPASVTAEQKAVAIEAATNAVAHPYEVTQSIHTEA